MTEHQYEAAKLTYRLLRERMNAGNVTSADWTAMHQSVEMLARLIADHIVGV